MTQTPDKDSTPIIDQVLQHLANRIEAGEFGPGDRLPSRSTLAKRFGASVGAVSIAVRRLGQTQPLTFVPGRGVYLAEKESPRAFTIGLIGRYASDTAEGRREIGKGAGYWGPILQGIVNSCTRQGQAVVVIPDTAAEPLDLDRILAYDVNCLISHGLNPRRDTILKLRRRGVPLVLGRRPTDEVLSIGVSYVDYDWLGALRSALRRFAETGHRRVACIATPTIEGGDARWREVFFAEVAQLGLDCASMPYCRVRPNAEVANGPRPPAEYLKDEVLELMALDEPPTAIFASFFDHMFKPTIAALDERQIIVGQDLSLIALAPEWPDSGMSLTTFTEPASTLAARLVETAGKLVEQPDQVFHEEVPFTLVERESVADLGAACSHGA